MAPNGYKAPILILYDTGCESTQISATLSNYSWCQTPADFIVKTVGERYEKSGCGNFVIESIRHPDKRINIDALYNDLTQTDVSSLYVKIPESWQHNYGFEPIVSSPGGMGMILVGTELEAQLHPLLKEIDGKLLLCESRIDQELILGGCIAEENIIHEDLQNLPATPYVGVNRVSVNQDGDLDIQECNDGIKSHIVPCDSVPDTQESPTPSGRVSARPAHNAHPRTTDNEDSATNKVLLADRTWMKIASGGARSTPSNDMQKMSRKKLH